MTSMLTTLALNLARNCGYQVFPCSADKKPAIPKYEGGNGFHDATADPETICRLFTHRNAALIGVATGTASGISVLDVDAGRYPMTPHPVSWRSIRPLGHGGISTPIGFPQPGFTKVLVVAYMFTSAIAMALGLLSRLSIRVSILGETAATSFIGFAAGFACLDHSPPAAWPDWLASALSAAKSKTPGSTRTCADHKLAPNVEQVIRRALERVGRAPEGAKHETLRDAARLIGGIQNEVGLSDAEVLEWLKGALPATIKDWSNVEKTALWGLEHGRNAPIRLHRGR